MNYYKDESKDLIDSFQYLKSVASRNMYPSYFERKKALAGIKRFILETKNELALSVSEDFGNRSFWDTMIGDVLTSIQSVNYSIKHLKHWMKPQKRNPGLLFWPSKAEVLYQPKGIVGIVVPWNFPIFLSLGPLTAAIAAGNRVMIKMPEGTPRVNKIYAERLSGYLGKDWIEIITGGAEVGAQFSSLAFDHIFFTGSTDIGKKVMLAAAENLVPVTLELGGKSPAIVDEQIDLDFVSRRLLYGKTINSGQACVAPDYILCPEERVELLATALSELYEALYPSNLGSNKDVTSIVDDKKFQRLQSLLDDALAKGAKSYRTAQHDRKTKRMFPFTILTNVNNDMAIMKEEIFGPILPIIAVSNVKDAISYVNKTERPLALYLFSFNNELHRQIKHNTVSGGIAINDASFQVAVDDLPFGGIGKSGLGNYHGKEGFITFSHPKSTFIRGKISFTSLLFPPYGKLKHKIFSRVFIR